METINYINDGGSFTVPFEPSDLSSTEIMLQEHVKKVQSVRIPQLKQNGEHWFCKKVCHFGRTCSQDGQNSICKNIHLKIKQNGIDEVIKTDTSKGYNISNYEKPGI